MLKGVSYRRFLHVSVVVDTFTSIKLSERVMGPATEEAESMSELLLNLTQKTQIITCFSTTPSFLKKSVEKVKRGKKLSKCKHLQFHFKKMISSSLTTII